MMLFNLFTHVQGDITHRTAMTFKLKQSIFVNISEFCVKSSLSSKRRDFPTIFLQLYLCRTSGLDLTPVDVLCLRGFQNYILRSRIDKHVC